LFCRYDGKQVDNERQQQDRNKNKGYCAEIVGLGSVIRQSLTDFFVKNNYHHLYNKKPPHTGVASLQIFDCTYYSRCEFTAKEQNCANVMPI
ncbi:hypothetical protein, partial [Bacteroides acidifaciens]